MTSEITAHARLWLSLSMMAFLTACEGGNGYAGDDDDGRGPPPPLLVATFESIQTNVFTPVCVECHGGATAPLGLRLDETSSYGLLVGISSVEQPGVPRVAPGNPNAQLSRTETRGNGGVRRTYAARPGAAPAIGHRHDPAVDHRRSAAQDAC